MLTPNTWETNKKLIMYLWFEPVKTVFIKNSSLFCYCKMERGGIRSMQTFIWGSYKTKYYVIYIRFLWWRCLCTYWQLCITDCVETQYALLYLWTIYCKRGLILAYLFCHLILNSKICTWLRLESFVVEEF